MKSPLRLFGVFPAALLCLSVCASAYSGGAAQAVSSSAQVNAKAAKGRTSAPTVGDTITIPGPLRSFLRMAGISQKVSPNDVLPLLARNVYLEGYQGGDRTEFLVLLNRYVLQARELQILAGASKTIHVTNCDDAGTLIQILGYRLREGCGQKDFSLETANPERAFLTIDSGFPLTELEEALQTGTPFTYSFPTSQVPVMFRESDWVALSVHDKKGYGDLVDALLYEPSIAHLYWALSKNDVETRLALARSPGLEKLLPFAAVLDFYGSQISIRSGRVIVPGGASTEQGWKDLVGASSDSPGDFVLHLVAKDKGWLAAYFDVLARVGPTQQEHLTKGPRLKRLYEAFRAGGDENGATRGVFRRAPDLLVLDTRLEWDPNGELHVPGGLDVWKEVFRQKTDSKIVRDLSKRARSWNQSEQLLEALTACARTETDSGPVQIYLMLNELDRRRTPEKRLSAETVRLLADKYWQYSDWYLMFSEFPDLNDASIVRFVTVADSINGMSGDILRTNALGAFQANLGLWQILARQGEIPNSELNASWQKVIEPFTKVSSSTQLFDAARASVGAVLLAANSSTGNSQDEIVNLLAGPHQDSHDGQSVHGEMTDRIRSVLDDQRLVSLDTLFALSDGLRGLEQGGSASERSRLLSLAGELREFEMPRPIFTNSEKISWAPGIYTTRHAELQVRTDLTKVIKAPATRAQLELARGQLTPFLRDTLVGLNYAYYEPPGAQILHNNPLFVRAHDFSGITVTVMGPGRHWRAPMLLGAGSPAGGGAYLMGSLADLPYALATTEQDFISPENVQALIWKELVPELLVNATLPRWWSVSPNELHAVALYQKFGEELLTASVANAELQAKVLGILSDRVAPQRLEETEQALLQAKDPSAAVPQMMPADTFYLAAEFRKKYPDEVNSWGPAGQQLDSLSHKYPEEVDSKRLSKDFGVPHPTLAQTYASELLNVKPFPFFGGYSSRLFGESWESSNLYWARLADEMGYSPVMLNRLVPALTVRMTAKIFATDLEDWPAMLRSMRETGEEFRQGKIVLPPAANTASSSLEPTVKDPTAQ
jgi:hypothetical protein